MFNRNTGCPRGWVLGIAALALGACTNSQAGREESSDSVNELLTGPACRVEYRYEAFDGGLRGHVVLRNVGDTPYQGWTLGWTLGGGHRITSAWNAKAVQSGTVIRMTPGEGNATIAPGDRTEITFLAETTANPVSPTEFYVDGVLCEPPGGADGGTGRTVWRPFDDDSPWNTPIGDSPAIDGDSQVLVDDLAASNPQGILWINMSQYSVPLYFADRNTPVRTVVANVVGGQGFFGDNDSDRSSAKARIPIPAGATPAEGTDQQMSIVDLESGLEWGLRKTQVSGDTYTCDVGAATYLSGSGVRPSTNRQPWWLGQGARSCGFPLVAGLIRVDEIRAGVIDHALALGYAHIRSRYFTPPASSAHPTTDDALPDRGIPCGGRVQLDPTLDLDSLGLTAPAKVIARALQVYGAFVGDSFGATSLYAESSPAALTAWEDLLSPGDLAILDLYRFRVLKMGVLEHE